ncbi:hypothetical protein FS842_002937 [Serendipita sp. 407]|nr:hypothetical protein FS842_002937 [Serendipita sp. 407]
MLSAPLHVRDTMPGPSTRSNPSRHTVNTPVRGRSRKGCWTCRIRRKKCDEQSDHDGRCRSCRRLQIQCLGWGERRPDWFKDTESIKAFKESIKKQIAEKSRPTSAPNPGVIASPVQSQVEAAPNLPLSPQINNGGALELPLISLAALVRPTTEICWDPYNYQYYAQAIQDIASISNLPNECMEAFRGIVLLGQWKQQELESGCLSYRALARRAFQIEKQLTSALNASRSDFKSSAAVPAIATSPEGEVEEDEDMFRFMDFGDGEDYNEYTESPLESSGGEYYLTPVEQGGFATEKVEEYKDERTHLEPVVAKKEVEPSARDELEALPYLSALLFLHCIVSGLNHRVPEIITTSTRLSRLLLTTDSTNGTIPNGQRLLATALLECISKGERSKDSYTSVLMPTGDQGVANVVFTAGIKPECGVGYYYSDADADADADS